MSFIAAADLAQAASFRTRVKMGTVKVAGTVLDEDTSTMPPAQRDKRLALAQQVLKDPDFTLGSFIYPVISNAVIASSGLDTTDADLEYQITTVWDDVAGVTHADTTTV
jgi:hypothetical protein